MPSAIVRFLLIVLELLEEELKIRAAIVVSLPAIVVEMLEEE